MACNSLPSSFVNSAFCFKSRIAHKMSLFLLAWNIFDYVYLILAMLTIASAVADVSMDQKHPFKFHFQC